MAVSSRSPLVALVVFALRCDAGQTALPLAAPSGHRVELTKQQVPLYSEGGVIQFKSAYHGMISIGTPEPQVMGVVFDTGSGHLVIPSTLCRAPTCMAHRRYKRKASDTAVDIDGDGSRVAPMQQRDQITVSYGTGEVTGIFMRDTVCLGLRTPVAPSVTDSKGSVLLQTRTNSKKVEGANATDVDELGSPVSSDGCLTIQFVAATEMSDDPFKSFSFDGVLGLGLSGLSQSPAFNFMEVASKAWPSTSMPGFEYVFSVFLGVSDGEASHITFGGVQTEMADSEFSWHNVRDVDMGYWQIDVHEIRANGVKLDFCSDGSCRAIADTGTSLLAVPSALGPTLVHRLRSANAPGYNCDGPGPVLEIDLGNSTIVLGPADFFRPEFMTDDTYTGDYAGVQAGQESDSTQGAKGDIKYCVPMVMHIDLPDPLSPKTILLGEPILQKYYTAFDMNPTAPRIGLALAKHETPRASLIWSAAV